MCSRLVLLSILTLVSLGDVFVFAKKSKPKVRHGPGGMSLNDTTTCVEFSKYARFNPYSVLFEKWFVFYYWGPPMSPETYIFTFPTANHTRFLHKLLDGKTVLPVDWSARQILMENQRNETSLLVERSDRGEFWLYRLYKATDHRIRPRDVRFKQTGDNRILGFMDCDAVITLAMSRLSDVPPKKQLQDQAARLGFRGRRGKSYLYQGHEWMPIPEDDDKHYWQHQKEFTGSKTISDEVKSSELRNEEVASQPTTPEKPEENKSNRLEKSDQKQNDTSEKNEEKEKNKLDNAEEIENDETEDDDAKQYKIVNVDENELKSRCVEIIPELWDDQEKDSKTQKPENTVITKDYLDRASANEIETTEDVLDNSISTNTTENKGEEDINNKKENQLENNESDKLLTEKPKDDSNNKEPHESTNEPSNQCQDCNEYVTSTDTSYVPENASTSKYLENTRFTEEPAGDGMSTEPVSSNDPSQASANTTNKPESPYYE